MGEEEEKVGAGGVDEDPVLVREVARSSGSELSDSGEWEVVEEANIAVDYSNVHVFLKTLQAWQSRESS